MSATIDNRLDRVQDMLAPDRNVYVFTDLNDGTYQPFKDPDAAPISRAALDELEKVHTVIVVKYHSDPPPDPTS